MIPANDSISVSIDALFAETRLSLVDEGEDAAAVDGERFDLEKSGRFGRVFRNYREEAFGRPDGPPFVQLDSRTNFPTAAGLASSAAGFAAVAFGLATLGGLSEDRTVRLARAGSGSACRSVLPGFVHWISGGRPTSAADRAECDRRTECRVSSFFFHLSSILVLLHTLPDLSDLCSRLRALIFVLSDQQKDVPSTSGLQRTLETFVLMERGIQVEVPARAAIEAGDFGGVAAVTMADSDHLHAVCADTRPPLHYLNDDCRRLIAFVREFNGTDGPPRAAYSFDAGLNCCCFLERADVFDFLAAPHRTSRPLVVEDGGRFSSQITADSSTAHRLQRVLPSERKRFQCGMSNWNGVQCRTLPPSLGQLRVLNGWNKRFIGVVLLPPGTDLKFGPSGS
ncbi:Diphosphomevalonate decarboxylase [Aphelenchoides fujianensis]|nr:Diphosphomevalonate decarboxylase [Aphelenchoides fujianensis]